MDAPTTQKELLQAMAAGRQEWEDLLAPINETAMKQPGVEGIWSIKDVLAHICAYEQYMAAMLADQRGDGQSATNMLDAYYQTHLTLYRAAHPDLPDQLQKIRGEQVNEVFVAAFRYKTVREVRTMEHQAYQQLAQWVEDYTDEELNRPFTSTGKTLLQIIPGQCYTHYHQHIPAIRAWWQSQA